MAEDASTPSVGEQQRREQADERRLARPVLAEDRDGLAPLHRERDAVEGRPHALAEAPLLAVAHPELLTQRVDLDGRVQSNGHGLHDYFLCVDHLMLLRFRT